MNLIDHIDIVTTHKCNNNCPWCIDKFIHSDTREVDLAKVDEFLRKIPAKDGTEVLLLGGEPTMLDSSKLIELAHIIYQNNYIPIMSTNGINRKKIVEILPHYRWIQITVYNDKQIEYWKKYRNRINIKLSGDSTLTMDKIKWFKEATKDFERKSISMYFKPDWTELCTDEKVWKYLNNADWKENGAYLYTFIDGIRYKRCITGKTNVIDEPNVPKFYPNGNYNKTWNNEEMDDYLNLYQ